MGMPVTEFQTHEYEIKVSACMNGFIANVTLLGHPATGRERRATYIVDSVPELWESLPGWISDMEKGDD